MTNESERDERIRAAKEFLAESARQTQDYAACAALDVLRWVCGEESGFEIVMQETAGVDRREKHWIA